jgi:hypothetical protein
MNAHELSRALADRHFAGSIRPAEEGRMRAHFFECAECRKYYERHLLFAELAPGALDERERMARGLGLQTPLRPRNLGWLVLAAAVALIGAGALRALLQPAKQELAEFTARGASHGSDVTLEIYRLGKDGSSSPVAGSIGPSDELAFAYTNRAEYPCLLVFAVDEHGHVFWFYPAFNDEKSDPEAIAIHTGPGLSELGEAVTHDFDGKQLSLFGLFTRKPLHVAEVEREIAGTRREPELAAALKARFADAALLERRVKVEK